MRKGHIAETIRKLLRTELDDCERALNEHDIQRARTALGEATKS
jgi:hypothetical protein